ncbi:hypothetical protein F6Y03_00445 [Bacillus megaterium]|nr:hypothetical protein [Priestia megaterium]
MPGLILLRRRRCSRCWRLIDKSRCVFDFAHISLIFRQDVGYTHTILAWLAIATVVFGVIGAVAYRDMRQIAIYNIVAAIGVMAFGISLMTEESMEGTIFYLLQDMVMKTALFFIVGAIAYVAGTNQLGRFSGLLGSYPLLGWTVFLSALALGGIPPFSGFIGKALIIRAAFDKDSFCSRWLCYYPCSCFIR